MADVRSASMTYDGFDSIKKILIRDISQFEEKNTKLSFELPAYRKHLQKFISNLFNLSSGLFCGLEKLSDISSVSENQFSLQYQNYLNAANNLHNFVVQDVVSAPRSLNRIVMKRWAYVLDELYKQNDFFSAAYLVEAFITIKKLTGLEVINKSLLRMKKNLDSRFLDDYELLRSGKTIIPNPTTLCSADKFAKSETVKFVNEKNPVTMTETLNFAREKLLVVQKLFRAKLLKDFESKQVLPVLFKKPINEKKFNLFCECEWYKKNDIAILRDEFLRSRNDLVVLLKNKTLNKLSNSCGSKIRMLLMESKAKFTWVSEMEAILKAEKATYVDATLDLSLEKVVNEIKVYIESIIAADKKLTAMTDSLHGDVQIENHNEGIVTRERALTKTAQELKSTKFVRIDLPEREAVTPRDDRTEESKRKKKTFESKMLRSQSSKLVRSKSKPKIEISDSISAAEVMMKSAVESPSAAAVAVNEEMIVINPKNVSVVDVPATGISERVVADIAEIKSSQSTMIGRGRANTDSDAKQSERQNEDSLKSRSRTSPSIFLSQETEKHNASATENHVDSMTEKSRPRSKTAISLLELLSENSSKDTAAPSVRPRSTGYIADEITKEVIEATTGSRPRSESLTSSTTAKLISQFSMGQSSAAVSPRSTVQKTGGVDNARMIYERKIQESKVKQKRYEAIVSPRRNVKEQEASQLGKTTSAPLKRSELQVVDTVERSGTFYK